MNLSLTFVLSLMILNSAHAMDGGCAFPPTNFSTDAKTAVVENTKKIEACVKRKTPVLAVVDQFGKFDCVALTPDQTQKVAFDPSQITLKSGVAFSVYTNQYAEELSLSKDKSCSEYGAKKIPAHPQMSISHALSCKDFENGPKTPSKDFLEYAHVGKKEATKCDLAANSPHNDPNPNQRASGNSSSPNRKVATDPHGPAYCPTCTSGSTDKAH